MALSDDERETLDRLHARLRRDTRGTTGVLGFRTLNRYYEGRQILAQLGLAVPAELRDFVTIVAWPGVYADSIEERCDVEGFRLPGQPEADTGLAEVWQVNDLDEESQMAHIDSLVFGRSYACVGTNEDDDDLPLITVESPLEMVHEWSPRRRAVTEAARFYADRSSGTPVQRATLYVDGATSWLSQESGRWVEEDRDEHGLPVPVVPLVNRGRLHNRFGTSELGRIITLTDAAARALTIAQIATELMGVPTRTAAGLTQADFTDPATGEALTKWEAYLGSVWATSNKDAEFHQFDAADLRNFTQIIEHYAQLVAGSTGLPLRYLGQSTTNPPSAEGIRADESRLVKTCERKQRAWGGSWERVMRLARLFQGQSDEGMQSMEVLWRDPATPTRAQSADAAVKLYQAGVISRRQARRDIGYTSVQINNMERDDANEASDPTLERIARDLTGAGTSDAA